METLFTTMRTKTLFLSLILFFAGWASLQKVQAQGIDDLGVVWSKTYGQGNISNIKPNSDGTYTACGYPWKNGVSTKYERLEGLVIEFDESGNERRRATARIPQSYIDSHPGNLIADDASAYFTIAFKTDDGGILAFGHFSNIGAPLNEKQYHWGTNNFEGSGALVYGAWIVKFDANLQVVKNTFVRGRHFSNGWITSSNTFIVAGFDACQGEDQTVANATVNITLLRIYDHNGDLISDKRNNNREIHAFYKYPDNTFIASTPDKFLRIDASGNITTATVLNNTFFPGTSGFYVTSVSPTKDGGTFSSVSLNQISTSTYQTYLNGIGFYKLNASYQHVYNKLTTPADTAFLPPLLLPGSVTPPKYVGTAQIRQPVGTTSVIVVDNLIYELTDNTTSYSYRIGNPYPNGTVLKSVSQVDGFFSCGLNSEGNAAIAKLSTCANFKLNVGTTEATLLVDGNSAVFPGRTINYTGESGSVTYNWTLTDITPGGPATDVSTTLAGAPNTPIPSRTFTLNAGKTFALLQYTITATDSYTTSGTPQSCLQTQTILVKIYNYPDNIIDADCVVEPAKQEWNVQRLQQIDSLATTHPFVVGDMNDDGYPDIVGYGTADRKSIRIMWGPDFATNNKYPISTTEYYGALAIAKVKISDAPDTYQSMIYYQMGGQLYAMKSDGTSAWTSNPTYRNVGMIGVADFNNDGWSEVYVGNQIYDAATGKILCDGGTSENSGTTYVITTPRSLTMAIDILGDEKLELVAGNKIYKVEIDRTTAVAKPLTLLSSVAPPAGCPADGVTVVADFNNDGKLEVLVRCKETYDTNISAVHLYLWSPHTGTATGTILAATSDNYRYAGVPFVGDIDGDGNVEIVTLGSDGTVNIIQTGALKAFKYNETTASFDVFWAINHTDQSGATGMTLFDFNNDGISEIVYRDEQELRIINGSKKSHKTGADTVVYTLNSFVSYSETGIEYPIVADIYGNGSSAILITSDYNGPRTSGFNSNARLDIFTSDPAIPWAPARKVWNQYAYNAVNVNENLTVPSYQLSLATVFPGKDETLGTTDDIRPYNSFLQQQAILNKSGNPLWLAPDAGFVQPVTFNYSYDGDSLVIHVELTNTGDAALLPPFYISAYKDAASVATIMATDSLMVSLDVNNTVNATVVIRHFSDYLPLTNIVIRINDRGQAVYVQPECEYDNNVLPIPFAALLMAHDDHTATITTTPIKVDVLSNDSIPNGCTPTLSILAPVTPHGGTATMINDSVQYTAAAGFVGFDTVTYSISCNGNTSIAQVIVLVSKLLSQKYVACSNASVTMGFNAISGVTYHWFDVPTAGSVISSGNTLARTKDATPLQTWWVEPRTTKFVFPRHRINLELGDCGVTNPTGCAVDGTILYKEDFGGNDQSDPNVKPTGIPQVENYSYSLTLYGYGTYTIAKTSAPFYHNAWYKNIDDHTYPNDTNRGYMAGFDGSEAPGQFYKVQIDDLCSGSTLYFSSWISNILNVASPPHTPRQIFIIEDTNGNVLAQYYTHVPNSADPTWKQYGFEFILPDNTSSIVLKIVNNGAGSDGNDFAMDDIEIRLCTPPVTTNINDTVVCVGNSLDIIGTYEADCVFGNDLAYLWEFRHADSVTWKLLTQKNVTIDCVAANPADRTITETVSIASASKADEGYYRMLVSSPTNIGSVNCRAASDSVYVHIVDKYVAPDIRLQICPSPPARTVQLSKYLDSTDYDRIEWGQVSPYPVIINPETGLFQDANLHINSTYTFKYTLRSPPHSGCGESTARVYMRVLNNRMFGRTVDTIVICSALATSRFVNLNQISGLELGGAWSYPKNTNNTVKNNIKEFTSPSKYAGAIVFNAQKAYAEADNSYNVSYKGVSGKAFDFVYTASCINVTKRVVLVVTL